MSQNREMLKSSLLEWYAKHPEYLKIVSELANQNGPQRRYPSLRQIDYFVVSYSKQHLSNYYIQGQPFEVHPSYKAQLLVYSKNNFDPFRRGSAMTVHGVETSLCQLNFFRWALPNGVVEYVMTHAGDIQREMLDIVGKRKRENSLMLNEGEKKRKKILVSPSEYLCIVHSIPTTSKSRFTSI